MALSRVRPRCAPVEFFRVGGTSVVQNSVSPFRTVCICLANKGPACLRRGIRCERWVQALALPDQDALYNATFYFPALDVRPLPVQSLFWGSIRSHSATPPSTSPA